MRFRRKPASVFGSDDREKALALVCEMGDMVALREDIEPAVDWQGAADRYEKALKRAQEGDWARALELRDEAREMLA